MCENQNTSFMPCCTVHNLSVIVCGHFEGNCVHVCVLTQLVEITSKCTDLDACVHVLFIIIML